MLSNTSEYALRMMVLLTEQNGTPTTCANLSGVGRIPQQYAAKVLYLLRQKGLVRGQRGRYGGYVLGCDANELTLLDVVNAIDPLKRIESCPLGRSEHSHQLCPMHLMIDNAIGQLESGLSELTLRQLVDERDSSPLCQSKTVMSDLTIGGASTG
jgi:Rrf2 family protein